MTAMPPPSLLQPFYCISVKESEIDYRDSRTNLFDHFETYDFDKIAATPKSELEHSTVSPFVRDYPVMRIFIVRNDDGKYNNFPLRITMTMLYADSHPDLDENPDPDLDVVRKLCGLTTPQFCVADLAGDILYIFQSLSSLNDYLAVRKFPAITTASVAYISGIALIYKELSLALIMSQMVDWMCKVALESKTPLICNMNELVYAKIYADATSMGMWIDFVVYSLHLCIKKTARLNAFLDSMIDLFDDDDDGIEFLDNIISDTDEDNAELNEDVVEPENGCVC